MKPTIIYRPCLWHRQWNSCNNIYLSTPSSEHNVKNHYKTATQQHFSKKLKTFRLNIFLIYRHCCWYLWLIFTFEFLCEIRKKSKMPQWDTQGPGRTDLWKSRSRKSRVRRRPPLTLNRAKTSLAGIGENTVKRAEARPLKTYNK
jgi:hypothetical protein